jgi:hypothetical protein
MMRRTNGKTNDAGQQFLRHSDIPAFLFPKVKKNVKKSQRGLNFSLTILILTQEKMSTV